MKKLLLCAAIVALGMGMSNAQDISYGVKAGLNLSNFGGDDEVTEGFEGLTSFHIGGFAQIGISNKFMIQPELIYSQQGAQDEEDSDFKLRINYLNLPIMAKYMVADGFSLEAGPQVGFAITRKLTDGDIDVDADDEIKALDFGVGVGAGYELPSGLMFSVRYNLGLANLLEDDFGGDDFSLNNNVLQVSVGYKFN
ncbi:porin family protein [Nonlabens sp.]|uniref:porin family protein n=1 Tax=Nonlabens sp. TaxID=1888209 RepID=UPI0025FB4B3F|nr:porin family protein [Nonlabens sp.]